MPALHAPREPRRGAAVVEFAMIAPLLVFVILGIFEISRGFIVKQTLSDAARKACRTGILPGTSTTTIQNEVNEILTDNGLTPSDATITVAVNGSSTTDASSAQQGDKISVKVAIPVAKTFWLTTLFLPSANVESEAIVMMRQG
jgi:Flp pilus assembly protein TadG